MIPHNDSTAASDLNLDHHQQRCINNTIFFNNDMLFVIFHYISSYDLIHTTSKVSQQWNTVSSLIPIHLKFNDFAYFISTISTTTHFFNIVELNLSEMNAHDEKEVSILYEYLTNLSETLMILWLPRYMPSDSLVRISKIKMSKLSKLMVEGCELVINDDENLFCNFKLKELMLTEITTNEGFENLANNVNLYGLNSLDMSISQSTVKSIEMLTTSQLFTNLTRLVLEHNHIDDEMIKILTKCSHLSELKELNLFANDIGNVGLLQIANCKFLCQLTSLDLRRNCFNDVGIGYLSNSSVMRNLQYLDISRNELKDESVKFISNSLYLTNIKVINMTSGKMSHLCVGQLYKLKHLKELTLCNNNLNQESMKILSETLLESNFQLSLLDLSDNPIDEGASLLFSNDNCSNITHLDLSLCQLPIKCIVDLSMSDSMINLEKLYLGCNNIGDEGLMLIASSLINLTHLYLHSSCISHKGIKYLCDGSLFKLMVLDLGKNLIENQALSFISQSTNLLYLEYLNLDGNLLSDLSDLLFQTNNSQNLPNLRTISVRKNQISKLVLSTAKDENVGDDEKIDFKLLENLEFLNLSRNFGLERGEISKFVKLVAPKRLKVCHDFESLFLEEE